MELLLTQLVCAFAPGLIGLALAAVISPRMFRLAAKVFQFDLTSVMLLMAAFAVLFAMNRTMREMEQQAWQKHLAEKAADEYAYPSAFLVTDFQNSMLTVTSIFTIPALIFARLVIDSYRDERRSRAERHQRLLHTDVQSALEPKLELVKPQWID